MTSTPSTDSRAASAVAAELRFDRGRAGGGAGSLAGCSDTAGTATLPTDTSGLQNLFDVPITGVGSDGVARFNDGDRLFEVVLRDADGLGPLYTRRPAAPATTPATACAVRAPRRRCRWSRPTA